MFVEHTDRSACIPIKKTEVAHYIVVLLDFSIANKRQSVYWNKWSGNLILMTLPNMFCV